MKRAAAAAALSSRSGGSKDPDDDYARRRKKVSSWDRTLATWGRVQVVGEICFVLIWLGGVFPIALYQSVHPVAPLPELPPQVYDTIGTVDRAHWRMTAHIALLLAFFSLMWGNGGEIGWAQFFILFVVMATDVYSILDTTVHIYYDQHPSLKLYEVTLAIYGLVLTCTAAIWYFLVYRRYHVFGRRFDGIPTEDEVFAVRLARYNGGGTGGGEEDAEEDEDEEETEVKKGIVANGVRIAMTYTEKNR